MLRKKSTHRTDLARGLLYTVYLGQGISSVGTFIQLTSENVSRMTIYCSMVFQIAQSLNLMVTWTIIKGFCLERSTCTMHAFLRLSVKMPQTLRSLTIELTLNSAVLFKWIYFSLLFHVGAMQTTSSEKIIDGAGIQNFWKIKKDRILQATRYTGNVSRIANDRHDS